MAGTNRVTRIKMCGMFRDCDIDAVNEVRPDYCGFIINFPKSHRSIDIPTLKRLAGKLDKGIISVGVFVDEDVNVIEELLNEDVIQMAQLHGNEDNEIIMHIRTHTKKPVIKAFCVSGDYEDYINVLNTANKCSSEHLIIDTGKGGGVAMNFSLMKKAINEIGFSRPFFLAGGLDILNLKTAIDILHPYGVDLSGGLETDRKKDPLKMREIMKVL